MTTVSRTRLALAALLMGGLALSANAQGKAKGNDKKPDDKTVKTVAKADGKAVKAVAKADDKREKADVKRVKRVTAPQAVIVTREVLVANGYQIVRVAPSGTSQIIYYRRGNMGKGRGLGPVEKIVVVPSGEVVRFQSVPEPLLATILRRLGM
jgi:hypothetical protein